MRAAIEHAGAERGLLIAPQGDELQIQAQATASGADVTVNLPSGDHIEVALPQSLVRYVMRTRDTVILEDASSPNQFSADPYLAKHGARSVLCLPLISQGNLIGVLYLENNLAPRVFGPARIAMLELLASQAAISLENTRLYRDLAQREAKIRRLVDANIVGIMFWDVDGGIRDANDAFLRMIGYESADLVSGRLRWTDLTPAEWLERDREIVEAQVRLTGHVPPYEKEFFRKDGSRVPVLIGGTVFDEENKYGIAFVVDITARKCAEEELRRSQHYLAEAQKVSHTGSWAWSPVSNAILYWSEECYRILGYDPAQGLPSFESSFERIHPEDRPDLAATIERAAREKTEFQIEYRLVLPDDTGRIVRLLSHPVLDASGEVAEFVGTVMDVTEHKRAEEDRREHLWFLESMDRINRAMQRSNDVELMTSGVMQQALEIFACNRACLIYPCDPDTPTYRTVMEHASPEYNGALTLGQDVPVPAEGAEILRRALHHPEAVIDPSLPPESRERFRIASMLAIAVHPKGDRPYLLVVYSSRSRPWTAAELRLFEEIARRLGDALTSVLAHRNLIAREKELRRSQQYLAEGQRLSHTGSWAWNPTTNEVPYWSQESYRIYGFDPAQGIPPFETTWERVHPEDRDALREAIERGLREKAGFQVEHRLVLPDATVRYHRVLAHPVLDASGELGEYLGTVVDITEQKRAEEERKEHLWFLESMDRINRAMQRTNDMEGMMSGVLKETLDIFDSDRARLVYPCDPDAALTRVVMEHSRPEYPGAFALGEDVPMDRHAADFLRRVLDSPGTATELSFPPEMRERFHIQSAIAIAVRPKGDRPYLFGLHQCSYARTWTAAERRLFEEIARRLEDALTSVLAHRNLLAREEELRQSEAYLAEAQKLSQTGSWAWSPDQDIRYWSEECYRVLSFDPQGGLPRFEDFLQRIHPDDQPGFREVIRMAIYMKAEWETDYRIVHPDGPVRDIHVVAHPILSTSGHLVEFVGTVIDVTERRRAEQRLVAQHRVARILAEAATMEEATPKILQAVCESMKWDVGVHWRVDPEAEALSCAEVWRKPSVEAAQLEAVTRARTFRLGEGTLGRVWASRAPAYMSDAVHDPDFGARAEMSAAGLRAAFALPILMGSEVLGVLGFFSRDVWQADQDLLDMMATIGSQIGQFCKRTAAVDELQLRVSMLQNIPVAAWSVRPDGTPDIVNQLWFEYTGQTPEDVNSYPEAWMGTLHPEDREKASQNYWDGIRSGQGFTTEARFLRARDGTYRWHLNRAVPVLDAEGNIVRFVGTSTDVHDWRQAQEALRNTQAEFAHMTRVMTMGELTASIAHEVNQPLGAIVTSAAAGARWLATKPPQLDKAHRALERIANDGKRAGEVIRRIRALMKRQTPRKDWLAINETILEVIALAQHQLRQSEILLETRLAQDLPLVRGDRVQLQQVLLNLIINAIEAMCEIKRPRELTIVSTADGADAVSVEVRDSGTGLDPEHAAHLFEPFYTTKAEGLGVGLSISRSIVEAHGGQLSAAANAPHGTLFRFSLPVNEPVL
jgi:PAS domain S-box-containing protein